MQHSKRTITYVCLTSAVVAAFAGCGPKPETAPEPGAPEAGAMPVEERIEVARQYMARGRIGEAAGHYEIVLAEDPENFEASLNMGIVLMKMEDARYENERDYAAARQYLMRAVRLRPAEAEPYAYLGTMDYRGGDYRAAIENLSRAADLAPGNESVHEMLGISLIEFGSTERGKTELLRALGINPDNDVANLELGRIYEKEGRKHLAMKHLERALEVNPNLDRARYSIERVYYDNGLYPEAEEACRKFLELYPEDVQSLEILGWIYQRQERTEDMLEAYARLTSIKPENTTYWAPIIQYHMDIEDYAGAREVLEECLRHNPYYAYGNVSYGRVLMHYAEESLEEGSRSQAQELYTRARNHLEAAKVDERYTAAADQLIRIIDADLRNSSR